MSQPKVLITGATGTVGRCVIDQLLKRDDLDILAVSRSGRGQKGVALDLHDRHRVQQFLTKERPQYLLHLAWTLDVDNPENLDWVTSSLELLKAFANNGGRRAVLAGSCSEYDWRYGFLSEELTPLHADTFYGTCKTALYSIASSYARKSELGFAWGRIFFLYGKGENKRRLVPDLIDAFLKGETPILKYPYIRRDYMHAEDVASALVGLLLNSSFNGAVNIASGEAVLLSEIADKIARIMGRPASIWKQDENNTPTYPLVLGDTQRLKYLLGFRPHISWEEGLLQMVQWRKDLLINSGIEE